MKTFRVVLGLILAVGLLIGMYFYLYIDKPIPFFEKEKQYTNEELVQKAQELFKQKKIEGLDMSNGPCLTNELVPDWVVDVAHSPRQSVDSKAENQCSAFMEGKAKHFIELDIEGNLIKIK